MAIVSRGGGGGGGGGGDTGASRPEQAAVVKTNLPPRTAPVIGRGDEMRAIAMAFGRAQEGGAKSGRIEVVGRAGVGASTIALELARRNGPRFPGGAWYLPLGMGTDLAWADIAVTKGAGPTKSLAELVQAARDELSSGPRALLVIDGVESAEQLRAALPQDPDAPIDILAVCETSTGVFDEVVEVSDVPPNAARRMAHSIARYIDGEDAVPPLVRSLDGLALTASLVARVGVQYDQIAKQQEQGPHPVSVDSVRGAVNAFVPLVHQTLALDALLLAAAAHPVRIPIDALFEAGGKLREGQGQEPPTAEDFGRAVTTLVRLGLVDPCDESRIGIHPLVQDAALQMMKTPVDRAYLSLCVADGMLVQAEEALGEDGVNLRHTVLHQLRFLQPLLADVPALFPDSGRSAVAEETRTRVDDAVKQLEEGLAISASA